MIKTMFTKSDYVRLRRNEVDYLCERRIHGADDNAPAAWRLSDENGHYKDATFICSACYELIPTGESDRDINLRRDAENVLTWETPSTGDPLTFIHLRRFAREVIRLLDTHKVK